MNGTRKGTGIMKMTLKFLVVGLIMASMVGCASRRLATRSTAPAFTPPPPPQPVLPPGAILVPPGGFPPGSGPPGAFPTPPPPPGPAPLPGFPTAPPGPSNGFPVAPPSTSSIPPGEALDRVGFRWQPSGPPSPPNVPSPPSARVAPTPPPPPAPAASPPSVLLLPPTPEPGAAAPPEPRKQLYPPESSKEPATLLPVGIFGFDKARDHVATGQRPTLEGLDWLQRSGYRVVVFLHAPGEKVDTDREQVERRGMKFIPIEIDARNLNRDSIDRFLAFQKDPSREKVFVYDLDGSMAGAMWYLSFRMIDQATDDQARVRAGSLGQGENRDAARDLWQSVRRYAEMN